MREFKSLKACIHGSDAHDLLHVGHPCSRRGVQGHVCSRESGECVLSKCWIKADPTFLGLVHAGLGEPDSAFTWLERACDERDGSVVFMNVEPSLDPLRTDGRFAGLLKRLNLDAGRFLFSRPTSE